MDSSNKHKRNIIFHESQMFTQWWLWLILIVVGLVPIYGIYKQILLGEPFGTNPMSDDGLIIYSILTSLFLLAFYFLRLKTSINKDAIQFSLEPFVNKTITWQHVKKAELVEYGFVGGYGIRIGTKHGTIYNLGGRFGLAIELENGKKFVIGTQKETELEYVVRKLFWQAKTLS